MATFENTLVIRRPIEDVFAFLADFENIPRWNDAIVKTHNRAVPLPSLLCPGRRPPGNPAHERGRARAPWPGPPARASRRATGPGRRGHQPPQAQGTLGAIGHAEPSVHIGEIQGLFTVLICIPCLEIRQARPDTLLGLHDSGQPWEQWAAPSTAAASGSLAPGIWSGTPRPGIPTGPPPMSCCGRTRTSASGSCTAAARRRRVDLAGRPVLAAAFLDGWSS